MTQRRTPLALLLVALLISGCGTTQTSPSPVPTASAPAASSATADWHDASLAPAARAQALLAQMTIEEKIGQMTQLEKGSVDPEGVTNLLLGSVLSGGGGAPAQNDAAGWYRMVKDYQDAALDTRLGIPILYGVDAVHGHNNVIGATIFPQQVGLGASHDVDLVKRIGEATALEMAATGIRWDFGPVVAVPQDVRWGRTYEGYGEDPLEVGEARRGVHHGPPGRRPDARRRRPRRPPSTTSATAGRRGARRRRPGYSIDQGVNDVDEATFRAIHLAPYETALEAGARIVMASFSSTAAGKVHGDRHLLTEVLKGELGFSGFVVSDWARRRPGRRGLRHGGRDGDLGRHRHGHGPERRPAVPGGGPGRSRERQDRPGADRRRRHPHPHGQVRDGPVRAPAADRGRRARSAPTTTARSRARRSAKSAVLLKTTAGLLPLATGDGDVLLAGSGADDIGTQSGGWTISWQGSTGPTTPGTTIADDLRRPTRRPPGLHGRPGDPGRDACEDRHRRRRRATVRGRPGRLGDARAPGGRPRDVDAVRPMVDRLIVVVLSGRPVMLDRILPTADAVVAAWLPGTEGAGVGDVLFGDAAVHARPRPTPGRRPRTTPRGRARTRATARSSRSDTA